MNTRKEERNASALRLISYKRLLRLIKSNLFIKLLRLLELIRVTTLTTDTSDT